jgi:hypothetical protein
MFRGGSRIASDFEPGSNTSVGKFDGGSLPYVEGDCAFVGVVGCELGSARMKDFEPGRSEVASLEESRITVPSGIASGKAGADLLP